jgi:hypothetical protein
LFYIYFKYQNKSNNYEIKYGSSLLNIETPHIFVLTLEPIWNFENLGESLIRLGFLLLFSMHNLFKLQNNACHAHEQTFISLLQAWAVTALPNLQESRPEIPS